MSQNPDAKAQMKRRAFGAIVRHAIFRAQVAIILAATILFAILLPNGLIPGWQWWWWLVIGLLASGSLILSSLTDPGEGAKAVAAMLRQQYDPARFRGNSQLKSRVEKALTYRYQIEQALRQQRQGPLREHLQGVADDIDRWMDDIYQLAERIDDFSRNKFVAEECRTAQAEYAELQRRGRAETDPAIRAKLEAALRNKRAQIDSLTTLQSTMEGAEVQLDNSLTTLGRLYAEALRLGTRDVDSGRAQRVRQEMAEEVNSLHDLVTSVDEVYGVGLEPAGQSAQAAR